MKAPVFVAFFGMVFRSHSLLRILSHRPTHRRTGWTSVLSFVTMALSGYLIQIASSPEAVTVFIWMHIVTSGVFVGGYGIHLVLGWRFHRART